ncbi:MAG: RNA polymerase sigma factor [Candidatus Paceibacterales bacterium]
MQEFTDHQLVQRYLKGDEKSFEVLVLRYTHLIYRFVAGYVRDGQVAQDITQDVFLKVFKNIKKVDKDKNFKSWIYTIAKNTAFDALKKKQSIAFSNFEAPDGKNYLTEKLVEGAPLPDKLAQLGESKHAFLQAIGKLSSKYKTVLTLYYYQGLNFREIAEKLEESINTVKSKHRRGLALLKVAIDAPNQRPFTY